ncbi:MAG: hypothetical protein WCG05_01735 [Alphaproteobacteria bacterium]
MNRTILFFIFVLAVNLSAKTTFVSGTEDLPLMPGLQAISDTVIFDKPDGRVITNEFTASISPKEISAFYKNVLPNLGWTCSQDNPTSLIFVRDRDQLTIQYRVGTKATTVTIEITPVNSK